MNWLVRRPGKMVATELLKGPLEVGEVIVEAVLDGERENAVERTFEFS